MAYSHVRGGRQRNNDNPTYICVGPPKTVRPYVRFLKALPFPSSFFFVNAKANAIATMAHTRRRALQPTPLHGSATRADKTHEAHSGQQTGGSLKGMNFSVALRRGMKLLICMVLFLIDVEARRTKRKKRQTEISNHFWTVIKFTYFGVFFPIIAYSIYSVARDPASGKIFKELWKRLRKRCVSNLNGSKKKREKKAR
jgi:hypothetical protein